jgi:hypothetical protein
MPNADDITINVIFPIVQSLYDAVTEQARSSGRSLDQLYHDACAEAFAQLPASGGRADQTLRSFHIEELGNRPTMGGLMQATLVVSPELYATVQAIAGQQHKPVEAICEGLCVAALRATAGANLR